jgi:hypothetical protein
MSIIQGPGLRGLIHKIADPRTIRQTRRFLRQPTALRRYSSCGLQQPKRLKSTVLRLMQITTGTFHKQLQSLGNAEGHGALLYKLGNLDALNQTSRWEGLV